MTLKAKDTVKICNDSNLRFPKDEYGTVTRVTKKLVRVKMHKSGQVIWATPSTFVKV